MFIASRSRDVEDFGGLAGDLVRHDLNSVSENAVGALHEVLLRDCWERGRVGQALSVSIFLIILGNMGQVSEVDLD